jgi:SAM-dependent methyltransferase
MPNSPLKTTMLPSENLLVQTLGGSTYALRKSPIVPWNQRLTKIATSILTAPLIVSFGLLWSVAMATPLKHTLMALLIPRNMETITKEFHAERGTLLKDVRGRVMDVGSGGGAYLVHCSNADEVVAIEPIVNMHDLIREKGKHLKKLTIVSTLDELLKSERADSFDWVILGNVLCEVPSVPKTLEQIDFLLKPGGKVYFSEHIARSKGTWKRWIQDTVNPCWRYIGAGCNCNRDSVSEIRGRGWDVIAWKYDHIQACMGPFVLGLAQKPK